MSDNSNSTDSTDSTVTGTITDSNKFVDAADRGVKAVQAFVLHFVKSSDALRALAVAIVDQREVIDYKGSPDLAGKSQQARSATTNIIAEGVPLDDDSKAPDHPANSKSAAMRARVANNVRQYTSDEVRSRIIAANTNKDGKVNTAAANKAIRAVGLKTDKDARDATAERKAESEKRTQERKLAEAQDKAVKTLALAADPDTDKPPTLDGSALANIVLHVLGVTRTAAEAVNAVPTVLGNLSAYLEANEDAKLTDRDAATLAEARGEVSRIEEALANLVPMLDTLAPVAEAVA